MKSLLTKPLFMRLWQIYQATILFRWSLATYLVVRLSAYTDLSNNLYFELEFIIKYILVRIDYKSVKLLDLIIKNMSLIWC